MASETTEPVRGYTQCPSCLTIFRVEAAQLLSAGGRARCGLCGYGFDAAARWRSNLPRPIQRRPAIQPAPLRPAPTPQSGGLVRGDRDAQPVPVEAGSPATRTDRDRAAAHHEQAASGAALSQAGAADPDPVSPKAPPWQVISDAELEAGGQRRLWPGLVAIGVLAVSLSGQLAWFHRHTLAERASVRPWLELVCEYAPCELPPMRRPEAVSVVERVITEHPDRNQALVLTATITNTADAGQPWPQLGLRLSALNGDIIARHWLAPATYRANPSAGDDVMRPGKHYALRVVFARPEREVAGFELAFR